jgi:hypothetical protein
MFSCSPILEARDGFMTVIHGLSTQVTPYGREGNIFSVNSLFMYIADEITFGTTEETIAPLSRKMVENLSGLDHWLFI